MMFVLRNSIYLQCDTLIYHKDNNKQGFDIEYHSQSPKNTINAVWI